MRWRRDSSRGRRARHTVEFCPKLDFLKRTDLSTRRDSIDLDDGAGWNDNKEKYFLMLTKKDIAVVIRQNGRSPTLVSSQRRAVLSATCRLPLIKFLLIELKKRKFSFPFSFKLVEFSPRNLMCVGSDELRSFDTSAHVIDESRSCSTLRALKAGKVSQRFIDINLTMLLNPLLLLHSYHGNPKKKKKTRSKSEKKSLHKHKSNLIS